MKLKQTYVYVSVQKGFKLKDIFHLLKYNNGKKKKFYFS